MAGPLQISLRSEAEAPWRSLRLVLFGFFAVSASIATVIALTQLIGAANNRGPQSVVEVLQVRMHSGQRIVRTSSTVSGVLHDYMLHSPTNCL